MSNYPDDFSQSAFDACYGTDNDDILREHAADMVIEWIHANPEEFILQHLDPILDDYREDEHLAEYTKAAEQWAGKYSAKGYFAAKELPQHDVFIAKFESMVDDKQEELAHA